MSESENVKVKQSVHNISYLNKNTVFTIRKKQTIHNIMYSWVKSPSRVEQTFLKIRTFCFKIKFLVNFTRCYAVTKELLMYESLFT